VTVRVVGVLGVGLVDPSTPVVHADDVGLTRGDGCFEGCRVIDRDVDKLDAHLARMGRSAAALEIDFDADAWQALIAQALAAWTEPGEASMRWFLTRGHPDGPVTGIVTIAPIAATYPAQRRHGIRVITLCRGMAADAFADAPWLLGGVKSLSYAVNMAAQREAVRRGADDVIFLATGGQVLEAPTSSVVWTHGDTMYTTPLGETGILGGTTQQRLFERAAEAGWSTTSVAAHIDELHAADAIFLTGTVRGPVDVYELDGRPRTRDLDLVATVQKLAGF
jgi:4-amino-4-deoxychorismate lyase